MPRRSIHRLALIAATVLVTAGLHQSPARAVCVTQCGTGPEQALALTASSQYLEDGFTWATRQALDWVQTGNDPSYLPSYWAGLTNRPAFYSRDLAHQVLGAHLLGLDEENLAMLRTPSTSTDDHCERPADLTGHRPDTTQPNPYGGTAIALLEWSPPRFQTHQPSSTPLDAVTANATYTGARGWPPALDWSATRLVRFIR